MRSASVVVAVHNESYRQASLNNSVSELLDNLYPGLPTLVKPGDRVFVKPYLTVPGALAPDDRRRSHPLVISALIEALIDHGCVVSFGDEGSAKFTNNILSEKQWMHDIAKRTGASLVSFAKTGAIQVRAGVPYPRNFLIARALLESDAIISCANCQPHGKLVLSGAVRNMFNAVVGDQSLLYELFPDPESLARIVVDVCRLVKPTISILDLTSVREPGSALNTQYVGLLLGSVDPVAVDVLAAEAIGYDKEMIWTTVYGGRVGLGCSSNAQISVRGLDWTSFEKKSLPTPKFEQTRKLGLYRKSIHILSKTAPRARPAIDEGNCTGCGDCSNICPVNAIRLTDTRQVELSLLRCIDCHLCVKTCNHNAVTLEYRGVARVVRAAWKNAKVGYALKLGPVAMSIRFSKSVSVTSNHGRRAGKAINGPLKIKDIESLRKPDGSGLKSPFQNGGNMGSCETALIVGVGPGLGSALARRFSEAGMHVAMAARNAEKLDPLSRELISLGTTAQAYGCDATDERSVKALMALIAEDIGAPDVVVFNVEHFIPGTILEIETPAFEECWRAMCLGAFLVGREAARQMVRRGSGTIIFTGATAGTRGRAGYINLAVGKGGIRMLAQSMARELGPKGIHVAHVVLDSGILSERSNEGARERMSAMFPTEIAETYFQLHRQHRSTWTHELDLRPWVETF